VFRVAVVLGAFQVYHPFMGRARDVFRGEPWRYKLSLWLLVTMLLAYVISGSSSGVFLVFIVAAMGWFVLYGFVLGCVLLARTEESFWAWFVRQTAD